MPSIFDWSATPSANVTVDGINIAENCQAANINNAARSIMALTRQTFSSGLQNFLAGTSPLAVTSGGTGLSSALTTNALVKQGATNFAQSIISDDGSTAAVAGNIAVNGALTTTGNAGIGTASPIDRLNVSDGTVNFQFKPLSGSAAGFFGLRTNHALAFTTNDTERLRIDTSGNVGIGTTSPTNSLHIEKAGGSIARFRDLTSGAETYLVSDSGGTALNQTQALPLKLATSNTTRLHIDASGNVGIGTTSPGAKLDVSGAGSFSGALSAASLALTTALALTQGGTGATSAASARSNLGAQAAMTVTTNANGTAFGFTISGTTYYIQCMPVGALGVNGSTFLTYPVALSTAVLAAMADKYVSGPINDGLNLGSGAPGLSGMSVTNGGTAMSGGYAIVIGY